MERLTRSKIAKMYGVSRPTLVKWISGSHSLAHDLNELGYHSRRTRILSPGMFEAIKQYLGEPPNASNDNK